MWCPEEIVSFHGMFAFFASRRRLTNGMWFVAVEETETSITEVREGADYTWENLELEFLPSLNTPKPVRQDAGKQRKRVSTAIVFAYDIYVVSIVF